MQNRNPSLDATVVKFDLSNPGKAGKYVAAGGLQKCVNVVQTTMRLATAIVEDATGNGGVTQAR